MMIRQENVTSRDLELLNVALDHALTPQEQVEFNKRLSDCPYLTTLYQQQRQLKNSMGQLPCYQVPHNFTLTRAEARKAKRAGFLQPMFGWASLVSALLVAVIFGSELIFRSVSLTAPMGSDNSQVSILQEDAPMAPIPEEAASLIALASEPVYLLNWGYGATGLGGIGGKGDGGGGVADSSGFSINISISPVVAYTEEMALEGAGAGEIIEETPMEIPMSAYPEEAVPEQEALPEETTMATPVKLEREAPMIYGIDPDKVGTILKMTPDSSVPQPIEPSEEHARIAEENQTGSMISTQVRIALLAAALVFGLIWLFLKFRR
jgi:hypothetical protein